MALSFRQLSEHFAAEVSPIDLRSVFDKETLEEIHAGMDRFGVLVFHDQKFSDAEQLAFAQRFDGELHSKTGVSVLKKSRLGNEALTDISNLDEDGEIMQSDDRRRMYSLGNRLWHTDASFQDPPGRYSMLHARVVPDVPADTEFTDTRPDGAPLHRLLAHDPRLRVLGGGGCEARRRRASARPHDPGLWSKIALRGVSRLEDHRLAGA